MNAKLERRSIAIRGVVQGVGFRPFVYGLASRLALSGFVRNEVGGVQIEVEGDSDSLDQFVTRLATDLPPLAQLDNLSWERRPTCGDRAFHIEQSAFEQKGPVVITPDAATCDDCLRELFDPNDRRYRYPFLNCTNCGPRLTIVLAAPYDRQRTTMAGFEMCAACRAEYEDPGNRRFHAQPVACPACGPRLQAMDRMGRAIQASDPLALLVDVLRAGQIAGVKGIGGFHLACDATNGAAVAELRRRKHRDEKPFALMVMDLEAAARWCEVSAAEQVLLTSPRRPIVLLRKRAGHGVAEGIAPGNPSLGIMLPYTPLHHLLLRALEGMPLVMTSGNQSDEPIAYEDGDAVARLGGIADFFLTHNRPIHVRCDDSVTRVIGEMESPIRRSRGVAPQPVRLPMACMKPVLAVGGQLKGAIALGRETQAIVSHHLGDLDHFEAYRAFERDVALYEQLFATTPATIAHDLHPDYASTRYAIRRAAEAGMECVAVQHHHAHMASCMAEHGLDEPVIGVTFDGTGYGTDGAVWGGEFLLGDYGAFRRAAQLRYVGLPGGDKAIREPWRMAIAHLRDAGARCPPLEKRHTAVEWKAIERMLERRFNTPLTSSAGRLFDAVAALAGVRDVTSYEGQAAMELEWLATDVPACGGYPFSVDDSGGDAKPWMIDTRPMIAAVAADAGGMEIAARIARRFHTTMVELIADVCGRIRTVSGLGCVVLSGGVFMNALLADETQRRLIDLGFRVYRHRIVPPNDGGLSLGQLAIAARRIATVA
jgi:hydrogenase maturation protein HypF